jgi:hypothetical protein
MFPINEIVVRNSIEAEQRALQHAEGMTKVNSGCYAKVFVDSCADHVVKIFRLHDRGYIAYLKVMAELEYQSRHLPKIFEVVLYRNTAPDEDGYNHPGFGVVYMEKLQSGAVRQMDYQTGMYIGARTRHERLSSSISGRFRYDGTDLDNLSEEHRDVFSLVRLAQEEAQKEDPDYSVNIDLHAGNIMWRGNTFVITDPLC